MNDMKNNFPIFEKIENFHHKVLLEDEKYN